MDDDHLCRLHALSLFTDLQDAVRARDLVPAFSEKRIAWAVLGQQDGLVMATESVDAEGKIRPLPSHHSWWVSRHGDVSRLFELVTDL